MLSFHPIAQKSTFGSTWTWHCKLELELELELHNGLQMGHVPEATPIWVGGLVARPRFHHELPSKHRKKPATSHETMCRGFRLQYALLPGPIVFVMVDGVCRCRCHRGIRSGLEPRTLGWPGSQCYLPRRGYGWVPL